ncbi:hypothetical protein POVWA2_032590 [Plasmodium ovale wallikeri]|uniref:Uncharacterized protein n=1 Tax=Plasmodium ovale wallikeri TaxID=864142 RepID=A0A1A8YYK8_PLAOA|nr:hypothetical protein POVWA1_032970 [Plasmodium ovale wallikeri]SBT36957.1 hypothetical protein POVWA2_032590 [Plasmodium ovale wallikeri]
MHAKCVLREQAYPVCAPTYMNILTRFCTVSFPALLPAVVSTKLGYHRASDTYGIRTGYVQDTCGIRAGPVQGYVIGSPLLCA